MGDVCGSGMESAMTTELVLHTPTRSNVRNGILIIRSTAGGESFS